MSDLNNMLEGTKILSLTDANGRAHEFISETEQEKAGFNMSLHKYVRRRNPAVREYLEIFLIQHS